MEYGRKRGQPRTTWFTGPNADTTRRTFRIVGGAVGGIVGLAVAIGLYGLTRDLLEPKPDAFGVVHHHPTMKQRLSVILLPWMVGGVLWFIGYQVADKCFDGIRWLVKKIRPHG